MSEINIKKSNKGKFTASAKRAGMGVQEFARHVLANKENYDATTVRRANFARNAKKWSHAEGGLLNPYYLSLYNYGGSSPSENKKKSLYAGNNDLGETSGQFGFGDISDLIGNAAAKIKSVISPNSSKPTVTEYENVPAVYDQRKQRLRPMNDIELANFNTYGHPDGKYSRNDKYNNILSENIKPMFGFNYGGRNSQLIDTVWNKGMAHNMSPEQISSIMAMVMNEMPDNFSDQNMVRRDQPINNYEMDENGNYKLDENGKKIKLPWDGKMERTSGPLQFSETYYVDPNDRETVVKGPDANSSYSRYMKWLEDNGLDPTVDNAVEYYMSDYIPYMFDQYNNRKRGAKYGQYGENNVDVESLWNDPNTDINTLADIASYIFQRSGSADVPDYRQRNFDRANKLADLYSQLYTLHSPGESYNLTVRRPKVQSNGGKLNHQFNFGGYIPLDGVVQLPPQYDGDSDVPSAVLQPAVPVSGWQNIVNNIRSNAQALPTKAEAMERISNNIYPYSQRPVRVRKEKAQQVPQLTLPLNIGGNIVYGVGPMPEWYDYGQQIESRNAEACGGRLRADGGDLGRSNGSYWPSGLTYVENGGTHEENPNQGVLMGKDNEGTPNLVEEGEVIYNDYVFSNRLHPTKDDLKQADLPLKYKNSTFAKIAEDMGKEIRGRENDPISRRGLSANLSTLAVLQEAQRTRNGKNGTQMLQGQDEAAMEPEIEGQFKQGGNKSKNRYRMSINGFFPNIKSPISIVNALGNGIRYAPTFMGKASRLISRPYLIGNSVYNAINYNPESIPMPTIVPNDYVPQLGYSIPDVASNSLAFAPVYPTVRFNADGGRLNTGEVKKSVGANLYDGYEKLHGPWNLNIRPVSRNIVRFFNGPVKKFFTEPVKAFHDLYKMDGVRFKDENGNKTVIYTLPNSELKNGAEPIRYGGHGYGGPQQLFQGRNVKYNNTISSVPESEIKYELEPSVVIAYPQNDQQTSQVPVIKSDGIDSHGSDSSTDIQNLTVPDVDYTPKDDDIDLDEINGLTPEEQSVIDKATAESIASALRYVNGKTDEKEFTPLDTSLRYAPIVGSAISALSNVLQNPDYSNSDILARAANSLPRNRVRARAINDYLTYNPLDRNYYLNQLRAQAGATRRAVNGSNASNAMAQNLAAGYNAENAIGNNLIQQDQYNNQLRQQIGNFNRATNQYNSQQAMTADQANAQLDLQRAQARMNALATVAQMRENVDDGLAQARSEALSQLFDNLGGLGRENFNYNQAMSNKASRYGADRSGNPYYKGPGTGGIAATDLDVLADILANSGNYDIKKKSCGGSLRNGGKKIRRSTKKI